MVIWGHRPERKALELAPWASCLDRLATTAGRSSWSSFPFPSSSSNPAPRCSPHTDSACGSRHPTCPRWSSSSMSTPSSPTTRPMRSTTPSSIARRRHAVAVTFIAGYPAATPEGHGPRPPALRRWTSGSATASPRTQGRRSHPRPGHANRGLERLYAQRARQVPDLSRRARYAQDSSPRLSRPGPTRPSPAPGLRIPTSGGRSMTYRVKRSQRSATRNRPTRHSPTPRATKAANLTKDTPDVLLWAALLLAPDEGATAATPIMEATGMSHHRSANNCANSPTSVRLSRSAEDTGGPLLVTFRDLLRLPLYARVCT